MRDANLYRHLCEGLPAMGIAVLVYDRRGSGQSSGDLDKADYEALADDAVAGQHSLTKFSRIDPDKIGFWGLSQGGWLVLKERARSPQRAKDRTHESPCHAKSVVPPAGFNSLMSRSIPSYWTSRAKQGYPGLERHSGVINKENLMPTKVPHRRPLGNKWTLLHKGPLVTHDATALRPFSGFQLVGSWDCKTAFPDNEDFACKAWEDDQTCQARRTSRTLSSSKSR
jgi:pimeloyl-ACP methyl ester carboxylesterase